MMHPQAVKILGGQNRVLSYREKIERGFHITQAIRQHAAVQRREYVCPRFCTERNLSPGFSAGTNIYSGVDS